MQLFFKIQVETFMNLLPREWRLDANMIMHACGRLHQYHQSSLHVLLCACKQTPRKKKVKMDRKHHVRRSPCTPDRRFHCRPPPPTQRYPLDPRNKKLKNQIGCCATSESNTENKADQTVQKTVHFHKFTICHAKKNYD